MDVISGDVCVQVGADYAVKLESNDERIRFIDGIYGRGWFCKQVSCFGRHSMAMWIDRNNAKLVTYISWPSGIIVHADMFYSCAL